VESEVNEGCADEFKAIKKVEEERKIERERGRGRMVC
jgi:hypothetical protein